MKRLLLVLPFLLLLVSCEEQKFSEMKWERATCIQLSYVPSTVIEGGIHPGMSMSGKLCFTVTPDQTTAERWCVVLKCSDHGKTFAFDNKDLYENITPGQTIELGYVEEYMVNVKKKTQRLVDLHTKEIRVSTKVIQR